METVELCPSHTRQAFNVQTLPLIVRWAEDICLRLQVDAIVGCGHSGLVVGGALSYATRIPLVAVRKGSDCPVAGGRYAARVNGILPNGKARRWVWLDDFFSSGGTFKHAIRELWKAEMVERPMPDAALLYSEFDTTWPKGFELISDDACDPANGRVPVHGFRK